MAALDEAVARIRGPRIEDYFAPDADQSFGPQPAMDPAALPDIPEPAQTWGEYGMDLARSAPGVGVRTAGGLAGLAAGITTGPGALATTALGLTAAEYPAQKLDEYFLGTKPSLLRGAVNIGAGMLSPTLGGKAAGRVVGRLAGPTAGRVAAVAAGGGVQGLGVTAASTVLEEGRLPTRSEALGGAGLGTAFGAVFGVAHEARVRDTMVRRQADTPEARAELDTLHQEVSSKIDALLAPESNQFAPVPGDRFAQVPFEPQPGVPQGQPTIDQFSRVQRTVLADLDRRAAAMAPDAVTVNASGESAASIEAINRQRAEASGGVQRLRVDARSGKATPLIGPEAVDAVPGPHDILVTEQGGRRTVLDQGAKVTPGQRTRVTRPGQAGELRMSLIVDAAFRAAKGVKTLADYTTEAVTRYGEAVRPYLAGAWREGRRQAAKTDIPGKATEKPAPPPPDNDLLAQIDAKLARAEAKLSDNPERQARMAATEKATMDAIEEARVAPKDPTAPPGVADGKQVERLLRLRAIAAGSDTSAKEAWRQVSLAKKANKAGKYGDAIAIGKRYGLTARTVENSLAAYTDPVDRARALKTLAREPNALRGLYNAGVRWNFLGTVRVPLKIAWINTTTVALDSLATLPAAGYSKVMHRGNQAVFANELPPNLMGYFHGMREVGIPDALSIIRDGLTEKNLLAGKFGSEYFSGKPWLDRIVNAPSRALGAIDALFTVPWAEQQTVALMANRARARGIAMGRSGEALHDHVATTMARWREAPPKWAMEFKTRTATRLGDSAAMGKWGEWLIKGSRIPVIGPVLLPFMRTILSGSRRATQTFTPIGAIDAATRIRRATKSPEAGEAYGRSLGWGEGKGRRAQQSGALHRDEAMRFGQSVIGSTILMAAVGGILGGAIIGSPPAEMSAAEIDRLGQERPWRSVGGLDANTVLGPAAAPVMAVADGIAQYQFATQQGLDDPRKAIDKMDMFVQAFRLGFQDMLRGVPVIDTSGQFGYDNFIRTLVTATPFAPAIVKNVQGLTGAGYAKPSSGMELYKGEAFGLTGGQPPKLSGVGEPITRKGVINPFSASPTHPNAFRAHAASVGVKVSPPDLRFVKTWDEETAKLPVAVRRVAEMALGQANARALAAAYPDASKEADPTIAASLYRERINDNRKMVMERLRQAATDKKAVTITSLTEGIE